MHIGYNTIKYSWLRTLECNGNERSIDECVETDQLNYAQSGAWYLGYGSKLYCVDYKLTGGISQNTGMLLAAFSGTQHTICYESFDINAGDVVCKHLQFNGLVAFTEGDPGSIPLFNNKLTCTGNERSLNDCTMSNAIIDKCTRAVYITCKAVRLTTWNEYNDEGAVEIFYNGSWGYVGNHEYRFNDETAHFLCKTLGFRTGGFSTGDHSLGSSHDRKAWLRSLSCDGTEADIMQCVSPLSFSFQPSHTFVSKRGTWLYCFGKSNNNSIHSLYR
ncbi:lysyl oxidase homolog 2-like [Ruditapes philippinarum]|uniref:lysyl oxidase homolog 2-like n=1 Tax=Ruditapes philippinarum TaxID=129788 RepID=UPI00295A6D98|nr:lysyl oxidase homolog 2-like [Ruditapes philippinarum]